jgi:hypothetical protein
MISAGSSKLPEFVDPRKSSKGARVAAEPSPRAKPGASVVMAGLDRTSSAMTAALRGTAIGRPTNS